MTFHDWSGNPLSFTTYLYILLSHVLPAYYTSDSIHFSPLCFGSVLQLYLYSHRSHPRHSFASQFPSIVKSLGYGRKTQSFLFVLVYPYSLLTLSCYVFHYRLTRLYFVYNSHNRLLFRLFISSLFPYTSLQEWVGLFLSRPLRHQREDRHI